MPAQLLFNIINNTPNNSLLNKLARSLRKALIQIIGNHTVNYSVNGIQLKLPFSHDLPLYLKLFPTYSQNLAPIAAIIYSKYSQSGCIDIGANVGDSVAFIKAKCNMPILCIEGNNSYIPLLKQNTRQFSDVAICPHYVGTGKEFVVADNHDGSAHLIQSDQGIKTQTLTSLIKEYGNAVTFKLLKIDTDGFDNTIIMSSADFLMQHRPVIFFEYDTRFLLLQNENPTDVFTFLKNHGYTDLLLFDNKGVFMMQLSPSDIKNLESITQYIHKSNGKFYLDICAIHETDKDLVTNIINHFSKT